MKKTYFSILMAIGLLGMSSCSQDEYELKNEDTRINVTSRSLSSLDSLVNDSIITPLMIDSNLLERAKTRISPIYATNDEDEYFSSNMYELRKIPLTIQARGNKKYLTTNGDGKEITLSDQTSGSSQWFSLDIPPATSGIPYLIYSRSGKRLSVGQYDNNPNNKVLFIPTENSNNLTSASWDLIPSSIYKGYFAIQSEFYLGQSDPNNAWSVFNYVLETKNTEKLGYGRYTQKAEQEFLITPARKFTLDYIEFHKEGSTVTKRTPLKVTTYSKNETEERRPFTILAAHYATDESTFSESSKLKIPINNTKDLFYRPIVEAEKPRLPLPVKPEDDPAPIREKPDMLYSANKQQIQCTLKFDINGTAKPNSLIEATSYLENYNVSANYTAHLSYELKSLGKTEIRKVKIKGTWHGIIYTTIRDNKYPKDIIKFYDLDDGEEIMRTKSITLSPITLK